jgi:hypothetical protein
VGWKLSWLLINGFGYLLFLRFETIHFRGFSPLQCAACDGIVEDCGILIKEAPDQLSRGNHFDDYGSFDLALRYDQMRLVVFLLFLNVNLVELQGVQGPFSISRLRESLDN